ncbi:MAG: cytochrome c oxidase subunit II [Euzebya sp.]
MRSVTLRQCLDAGRTRVFIALGSLAVFASGCSTDFDGRSTANIPGPDPDRALPADALNPLGPISRSQDQLWDLAYPIAIIVFLLVFGGLAFIMVRFRDKGQTELPKQIHGNTKLEIAWTIVPALILVIIAVPTVQKIFELSGDPAPDAVLVDVVGKQYWWQFEYLNEGFYTASELHIPTGREVFVTLNGSEPTNPAVYQGPPVMHSFWVPSLAGKRDFVPGAVRTMRIQADEPGVYPGNCAEFCGLSHANMRFTVIAHTPEDYDAWVSVMQSPADTPEESLAAMGEEVFGNNCVGCHNISGNPNVDPVNPSRFAPDLTHFAQREAYAGYIVDSPFGDEVADPEQAMANLRQWIRDPKVIKPGAQMPPFASLSEEELDALIAYLGTLE